MSELKPASPEPSTQNSTTPPVTKKKRRIPRWLKIAGVLVVVVGLLILLAPTIASTGPVRSYLVGKVNQNLDGRIEIEDWSIGWLSGLKLSNARVFDSAGTRIARLGSLQTELSVLDLIRGEYSLGEAVIDGLDVAARRDSDGKLNFAKLAKEDSISASDTPQTPSSGDGRAPEPSELPDFSGHIEVRNSKGTYEDAARPGVRLEFGALALDGTAKVSPDGATFDVKGVAGKSNIVGTLSPILQDYALTLDAAGEYAPARGTRIARLAVKDNQGMVLLEKGAADLLIPTDAKVQPTGEVKLGADLKKLVDVSRALSAKQAADGPQLQSGRIDGVLGLADLPNDELIGLTGKLDATALSFTTRGEPIKDEKLTLTPSVRFARDLKRIDIDFITIAGRLINGRLHDTVIDRAAGDAPGAPMLAALRKANLVIDVPRLGDVYALMLAISPPAEPKPGAPPAGEIRSGSASVRATLGHQGNAVVITPEITAKALTIGAGDVSRNVGDINLRTAVRLVSATELTVPTLTFGGAGANVKLEQPLVLNTAGDMTTLSAILSGKVNLAELLPVVEAWRGAEPGTVYPYAGDMTLRQTVTTKDGTITLAGQADINNFTMTGESRSTPFAEPHIAFANDITVEQKAKVLQIKDISFAMETTSAVRLALKGAIREFDTIRQFDNVTANVTYNATAMWDILRPLMDPETGGKSLQEWTVSGEHVRQIAIAGSYPAGRDDAIKFLRIDGGFALDSFSGRGIDFRPDLRFALADGRLALSHAKKQNADSGEVKATQPSDAVVGDPFNGGTMSVEGVAIDLNGEHARLITPPNHPLVRGATINPVFADTLLARFVNPVFNDATQARGLLNVTIVSCDGLALGTAMQSPDPAQSGRAEIRWSLDDLFLGQPELVALVSKIKPNALNESGFSGGISDGRIRIEGGKVQSAMTFTVDKYAIPFDGGIALAENQLIDFKVNLRKELFAAIDERFARSVPGEGYAVVLVGTTENWFQNATASIVGIVADLGVRAGIDSVLDRALGGDKDKRPADGEPTDSNNANPLDRLLEGLQGGKRETDEEKEARRAKIRQERAERAATQPADAPADKKPKKKR